MAGPVDGMGRKEPTSKSRGGDGTYDITIKDLDAARIFKGVAAGDHIEFQRDGATRVTEGDERRGHRNEVAGRKVQLPHGEAW